MDISCWLRHIARRGGPVLVASDFDGTLADIAPRPEQARLRDDAREALLRLREGGAELAVISGRPLADLRGLLGGIRGLWLAGERGAEIDRPDGVPLRVAQVPPGIGHRLLEDWRRYAEGEPGVWVEAKPHGGTLHYRAAPQERHADIRAEGERICARHGSRAIEA